jgi:tRNA U34 5-methylaminomethyl-2-thiouridine-forming methyltransferase MnmC
VNRQIEIRTTADGSKTLYLPEIDENYHSCHGAIQEANHVFIKNGLSEFKEKQSISVFEMGFGTGLNALLTLVWAQENEIHVDYEGVEAYPISPELCFQLEYPECLNVNKKNDFEKMILAEWNQTVQISHYFEIKKNDLKIENWSSDKKFDIVFFDAFGPRVQNEVWEIDVLKKMFDVLLPGGILVTYCAQGQFKRNLKSLGFELESLPGPPGKREMIRARKN